MSRRHYNKGQLKFGEYRTAGENRDFRWTHEDIEELKHMYCQGYSLNAMSKYFDRRVSEVLVMLDDLLSEGKIEAHRKLVLV